MPLSQAVAGTWEVVAREDRTKDGALHPDPALGSDPVGLIFFDRAGNFATQIMKRDRSGATAAPADRGGQGANNPLAVGGYDAYFGTYVTDDARGTATFTLRAALSPASVGMVVTRALAVEGDALTITLDTKALDGLAVTRTLRCRRLS
jgi:hypothetical protein